MELFIKPKFWSNAVTKMHVEVKLTYELEKAAKSCISIDARRTGWMRSSVGYQTCPLLMAFVEMSLIYLMCEVIMSLTAQQPHTPHTETHTTHRHTHTHKPHRHKHTNTQKNTHTNTQPDRLSALKLKQSDMPDQHSSLFGLNKHFDHSFVTLGLLVWTTRSNLNLIPFLSSTTWPPQVMHQPSWKYEEGTPEMSST